MYVLCIALFHGSKPVWFLVEGDSVWDPDDDRNLLNEDEKVYKSLEKKYGERLVLKRQQFLAMNSSSLHV